MLVKKYIWLSISLSAAFSAFPILVLVALDLQLVHSVHIFQHWHKPTQTDIQQSHVIICNTDSRADRFFIHWICKISSMIFHVWRVGEVISGLVNRAMFQTCDWWVQHFIWCYYSWQGQGNCCGFCIFCWHNFLYLATFTSLSVYMRWNLIIKNNPILTDV